jgi:hypothetical protein
MRPKKRYVYIRFPNNIKLLEELAMVHMVPFSKLKAEPKKRITRSKN